MGGQADALEARLLRDPDVQRAFDELAPQYEAARLLIRQLDFIIFVQHWPHGGWIPLHAASPAPT